MISLLKELRGFYESILPPGAGSAVVGAVYMSLILSIHDKIAIID